MEMGFVCIFNDMLFIWLSWQTVFNINTSYVDLTDVLSQPNERQGFFWMLMAGCVVAVTSDSFDENCGIAMSEEDSETQSTCSLSSGNASPVDLLCPFPPSSPSPSSSSPSPSFRPRSLDLPSPNSLSDFGLISPVLGPRSECSGASSPDCDLERGKKHFIHLHKYKKPQSICLCICMNVPGRWKDKMCPTLQICMCVYPLLIETHYSIFISCLVSICWGVYSSLSFGIAHISGDRNNRQAKLQ